MIRINLLPVGQKRRIKTAIIQLVLISVVIVSCVGIGFAWNYVYQEDITAQREKIAKEDATISQLQKTIGEVNTLKKTKAKLNERKEVIDKLQRGKTGPVRMLDDLANQIPKRVWIESLSERKGVVRLEGMGLENSDISEFMRALNKSKYFTDVSLQKTSRQDSKGVSYFEFEIRAKVDFAG